MERSSSIAGGVTGDSRDLLADQSSHSSKKRAKVWEYIETAVVDGKDKATCRFCKLQMSNERGKGTNHLNRHIAVHCVEIPQEDRDKFLKSLKKAGDEEDEIFDPEVCRSQRSELDKYLDDPRVQPSGDGEFDVMAWWKKNSDAYPVLSQMARDLLSIPVSTVSSESAFSAAGRVLGKERTSLSPETLEALICSKDWFVGFSPDDEGQPIEGRRIFDEDEDDDTYDGYEY